MKGFLAALLFSAPLLANAFTWTAADPAVPVFVDAATPYHYTFNLLNQGFVAGTDTISNYDVSLHLFDDSHSNFLNFNTALLDQPGLLGDDLSIFWSSADLGGASLQGKLALNQTGLLDVTVFGLGNSSFYIDTSSITATGTKNSSVPEPTSLALLAAGMIGIVVMRRISSRAN